MYAKEIKFTDYNGKETSGIFYFNLNEAEIMEFNAEYEGGLKELLEKIAREQTQSGIVKLVKKIILMSYGEKSLDGKRFIKNDELRDAFKQTDAYNRLFMELSHDDAAAAEFINNVIPSEEHMAELARLNP